MDTTFQIQGIKSQIDNMKLQIENIEMNFMNPMSMFPTSEQLLNLSMQLLNTGIQAFNIGKNQTMIVNNKYTEQLKTISDNINNILNSLQLQQMQAQMMQQQQMMIQQQMMMQQQMMNQQHMEQPMTNSIKINVIFRNPNGTTTNFVVDENITIRELLDKYMEKEYGYIYEDKDLVFLYNVNYLKRNDNKKLKILNYLRNSQMNITVIDTKNLAHK